MKSETTTLSTPHLRERPEQKYRRNEKREEREDSQVHNRRSRNIQEVGQEARGETKEIKSGQRGSIGKRMRWRREEKTIN